jgi:3-phosphoshikimate 1-carboxyvinyltransferase
MIATIYPSLIQGSIRSPRSKSDMQRACAAALLREGITTIVDPGRSNDDMAALDVIAKLGAVVQDCGDKIIVTSNGVQPHQNEINCGESGLGIRMFTPIAALSSAALTIIGKGSLVNRPMDFFDEIFPQLGIAVSTQSGKLPLHVKGPLVPKNIVVDGSLSSQFLTGLLMAFSAINAKDVTIEVRDLKSKPYIVLTLRVLKDFGMKVPVVQQHEFFIFSPEDHVQSKGEYSYKVEGDWSGAAFLFVAGAINNPIVIEGMRSDSVQADMKILEAIKDAGALLSQEGNRYKVAPASLHAFEFDATECPDLFPPLVALAAYCKGVTKIKGVNRLIHKESNRGLTLQDVFGKMGIQVELEGDMMLVYGGVQPKGANVHSHHDHRIAMAAAIAALGADGPVHIADAEAIDKSYPAFYNDLKLLGVRIDTETY